MEKINNTLSMGAATHAAKRAADIIFALQNKDRLEYQQLIGRLNEILEAYGEASPDIANADLDALKAASRKLLAIFKEQDVVKTVLLLNELLTLYARRPRLSAHGGSPWHMHVDSSDQASWVEWFTASSAFALAVLLAEKQRSPGGLCGSPVCGRPFIDTGKGGGRKYCSPRCATRERVGAYRERHQS